MNSSNFSPEGFFKEEPSEPGTKPMMAYFSSAVAYSHLIEEGRKLRDRGLDTEAIGVFLRATKLKDRRALAYVEIAICHLKLGNLLDAYIAGQMANNRAPDRNERFMILMTDYCIAYERFSAKITLENAKLCHEIINLQLDISPQHPVPLANRVLLHLDLACEKTVFELTRRKELLKAVLAFIHYMAITETISQQHHRYVHYFWVQLKPYLDRLPASEQPKWRDFLTELHLRVRLAEEIFKKKQQKSYPRKSNSMRSFLIILLFFSLTSASCFADNDDRDDGLGMGIGVGICGGGDGDGIVIADAVDSQ